MLTVCLAAMIMGSVAQADAGSPVALLRSGRTFVPVRAVGEMLGATVVYASGAIEVATASARSVHLTVGQTAASVDGAPVTLDAAPFIIGGLTYVPLRFMSEALGASVSCDTPCRTVLVIVSGTELPLTVVIDRGASLTYQGAWFDVDYPRGFTVLERELCASSTGYDGVSFLSPDGAVEFYVFSPQWSGQSQWATIKPGEREVSRSQERQGDKLITWVEVAGEDGPSHRAWVEIANPTYNVNHFFGIRYQNQADYQRYQSRYLSFKESLVQYAD